MWKWLLTIALLFLLGSESGAGLSSSGTGISSSGTGSPSNVGLPSGTGYNPCQESSKESLKIGLKMGQMYALAQQGQNISDFNAEVDKYNAWVQQNLGNDPNLLMPKMQESGYGMPVMQDTGDIIPSYIPVPRRTSAKPIHAIDASFNQTNPTIPPIVIQNGRISDMPAGAWWTTYGPYLHHHHGRDYYGALGSV